MEYFKNMNFEQNNAIIKGFLLLVNELWTKALTIYEKSGFEKIKTFKNFFDNGENLYGIVGGKTNYITPDISYDIEEEGETRLSRCFLKDNHYEYSNRILVIDHKSCSDADDEAQALFTETYIQRLFNLVNS